MDEGGDTGRDPRPVPPRSPELATEGPLSRDVARALLERGAELLAAGDHREAAAHYRRVIGFDDATVTAAALLGLAEALYRLDQDDAAVATWESILELPETPSTYAAWRNIAAARVRDGDLTGAIAAYREADRRAPATDKAEIASRLGWLAKETGDRRSAGRYFNRARGTGPAFPLTWLIIGLTVIVSISALGVPDDVLIDHLMLDKGAVANGEYWRLWTVALVHGSYLHLAFNMYALFIVGPIVEQIYGSRLFVLFYLLCAAAGSIGSFIVSPTPAVGASGAVFGLFGVLLAATRTHNPVLDRRGRALTGQIGMLIVVNLAFGFIVPRIDNAAHVGGLLSGVWLGFLIVPGRVATLRSLWTKPGSPSGAITPASSLSSVLPLLGVGGLVVILAVGLAIGSDLRG